MELGLALAAEPAGTLTNEQKGPIMAEYTYTPGDRCRLLGDFKVEHADDCPDYPAGAITDVRTGKIVRD